MEAIEKELKYQINKTDYFKLMQYLDNNCIKCNSIIQTNYYIDDFNFTLNKNNITARIRKKSDEKYEFTLKIPINNISSLKSAAIKKEITIELNNKIANNLIDNGIWNKKSIDILYSNIKFPVEFNKLKVIGSLTTERIFYKVKNISELLSIDKSTYFDIEDFEVEWETNELDKCNDILLNVFNNIDVNYIQSNSSKNTRFIKRLNEVII